MSELGTGCSRMVLASLGRFHAEASARVSVAHCWQQCMADTEGLEQVVIPVWPLLCFRFPVFVLSIDPSMVVLQSLFVAFPVLIATSHKEGSLGPIPERG